jgi:hypothetical protein
MPSALIKSGSKTKHTDYTILSFPSWRAIQSFAKKVKKSNSTLEANKNFKQFVEGKISSASYGLFGKNPKTYEEAMNRDKFVYYKEYKKVKEKVEKKVKDELAKSSLAEVMKPKFVYNDKQIGEFIFERASMSLKPKIYLFCPSENRVVDSINEKIYLYAPSLKKEVSAKDVIRDGNLIVLNDEKRSLVINTIKKDDAYLEVVNAIRVKKEDGKEVYLELKGEETLIEARKLGIIDCTSSNKKVYLYKENKPKEFKSIKIIVSLTAGGFTDWTNDFYTGLTAGIIIEVLESLGYAVEVVIAVGGGRCGGCYKKLNFNGKYKQGRRFFLFTAKYFDEQLDIDGLLYTLCDPSFHNIKWISLFNSFLDFFGDQVDTKGNPASTWHGIEKEDLVNPIGSYVKGIDEKKGNKNLLHFYINKVKDENEVIKEVFDIAQQCENLNYQALKKYKPNEFKDI